MRQTFIAGELKKFVWKGLILGQTLIIERMIYYNIPSDAYVDCFLINWGMAVLLINESR